MDDIDDVLKRLAAAPIPAGLASIDDRVWAGIAASKRDGRSLLAIGTVAVVGAITMGIAVGGFETAAATAAPSQLSLNSPLAPSTLLIGPR